jgi:hypothetical protein
VQSGLWGLLVFEDPHFHHRLIAARPLGRSGFSRARKRPAANWHASHGPFMKFCCLVDNPLGQVVDEGLALALEQKDPPMILPL